MVPRSRLVRESNLKFPEPHFFQIEQYNQSEITNQPVPDASMQLAATATVIVSSSAPRALTSVQALGLKPALVDALFCEAQLPYGHWKLPRLSPFT